MPKPRSRQSLLKATYQQESLIFFDANLVHSAAGENAEQASSKQPVKRDIKTLKKISARQLH